MILYINTSEKEEFSLDLSCLSADRYKNKLVLKTIKTPIGTMSERFLTELDNFLKLNQSCLENLTGIIAFQGPGSYTSLRIGISIANALAWSLNVPIFPTKEKINQKILLKIVKKIQASTAFDKPVKPYYFNKI